MCALFNGKKLMVSELHDKVEQVSKQALDMRSGTEEAKRRIVEDHKRQMAHYLSFRKHYEAMPLAWAKQIKKLESANSSHHKLLRSLKQRRAATESFYAECFPLIQAQLESLYDGRLRRLDDAQRQLERE